MSATSDPPAWENDVLYDVGDRVTHNGSTWEATIQNQTAEPAPGSTFWTEVDTSGGSGGDTGPPTWANAELYQVGDQVRHDGSVWRAVIVSRNAEPTESSPYWTKPGAQRGAGGEIVVEDATPDSIDDRIESLRSGLPDNVDYNDDAIALLDLRIQRLEAELLDE